MKNYMLVKNSFLKTNFKPHIHENFSIGKITYGECKLNINKSKKLIRNNEIRIINPLETHYVENDAKWSYINLFIKKEYVYNITSSFLKKKSSIKFPNKVNDKEIGILFNKLINNFNEYPSDFAIEENITQLLETLTKKYSLIKIKKINNENYKLKIILDYIYEYYLSNIKLQHLEDITGISKYHIIRIFKQKFFLTPYQFILKLRIEYAIELIKKDYPLSIVAVECGFFDQSHFIKEFKKVYGMSPLEFIKKFY